MISDGRPKRLSAEQYFKRLADLLLGVQVTDGQGREMPLDEGADQAVALIQAARSTNNKVMMIGNGGSAAIASHMHNDLCKAVGVRALVFHDLPLLTALTNDHGYGCVYERPIERWADRADLLFAISSSGQSENILRAVLASSARGCRVVTLSGFQPGNPLRGAGNLNFYVASQVYGYVELVHAALTHFFTDCAALAQSEVTNSNG
jgi:D-sedoheptulose 7-phosphate isomerase